MKTAVIMEVTVDDGETHVYNITKSQAKRLCKQLRQQLKSEKVRDWDWARKQMWSGRAVRQEKWPTGEFIEIINRKLVDCRGEALCVDSGVHSTKDWQLA